MKIYKALLYISIVVLLPEIFSFSKNAVENKLPPTVMAESGLIRTEGDQAYRDLNKNGKLDFYEDPRQPVEKRIQDLLSQMTLEEKAGMMFYSPTRVNSDGSIDDKPGKDMLSNMSPVGITEMDKR